MRLDSLLLAMATLAMCMPVCLGSDWIPPDNPDPQAILQEAGSDARAKRYKIALAKHVWFHENANRIQPSLVGVRRSFALSAWKNLGQEYPPAMEKLPQIRDDLAAEIHDGIVIENGFGDLAAINRTLGEDAKTVEAYKILAEKNRSACKRAFPFARDALIKEKEYALYLWNGFKWCGPVGEYEASDFDVFMAERRRKDRIVC